MVFTHKEIYETPKKKVGILMINAKRPHKNIAARKIVVRKRVHHKRERLEIGEMYRQRMAHQND